MFESEYFLEAPPLHTVQLRKAFLIRKETHSIDIANGSRLDVSIDTDAQKKESFVARISRFPYDSTVSTYDNYYHCDFVLRVNNSTQISRIRRVFYRCCEVEIDFYRWRVDSVTKFAYDSETASFVLALAPFGPGGALLVTEVASTTNIYIEVDAASSPSPLHAFAGFFLEWHNCELNVDAFVQRFYAKETAEQTKQTLYRGDFNCSEFETMTRFGNGRAMIGKSGFKKEFSTEEATARRVTIYDSFERSRNTKSEISENLGCLVYAAEEKLAAICDAIPFAVPSPYSNIVFDSFPPCKMIVFPGERRDEVKTYLEQIEAFNFIFKPLWKEAEMDREEVALAERKKLAKAEFEYACYLFLSGQEEETRVWKSTKTTEPPLPKRFAFF